MAARFLDFISRPFKNKSWWVGIGIALLIWLSSSSGIPIAKAGWISPTVLLHPDGTLNLTTGKTGALDLQGWNVRVDPARGPVFAPAATLPSGWHALSNGVDDSFQDAVSAIAVNGTDVYVGGDFTQTCGTITCSHSNVTVNHIAKWNGTSWSALGNGLDERVYALAVSGTTVYAGGYFLQVCGNLACDSGNTTVNRIAKWNGSSWSALGYGVSADVQAIAVSGTQVYVGGWFISTCGSVTCGTGNLWVNYVAKWNGTSWSALGNGVNTAVYTLAVSGTNVYAGGYFTLVCGNQTCSSSVTVNHLAKWNGASWSALSYGVDSYVYAIALMGANVFAGGTFRQVCGNPSCDTGNLVVNHIAQWDGSGWSALSLGLDGNVYSLAVSGSNLYVGGLFLDYCIIPTCDFHSIPMSYVTRFHEGIWYPLEYGVHGVVNALALGELLYVGGDFPDVCANFGCTKTGALVNRVAQYNTAKNCTFPGKARLIAPKNGATVGGRTALLKWRGTNCVKNYYVTVHDVVTDQIVLNVKLGGKITQVRTPPLTRGKTYAWQVGACGIYDCYVTQERKFKIAP